MVLRLAAATVVFLLLGVAVALAALPPGGSFTDDDGNIHEGAIEAIAAEGITKGCNPPVNDLYCPDDIVTRGQMAAFLVRALDLTELNFSINFVDSNDSVFQADIIKLATAGITYGCNPPTNDHYCPDDSVTRGQMAAFLVRALDLPPTAEAPFIDAAGVFEDSINRLAVAGITKGCNPPINDRYCPNDPVKRDQMASFLGRALGLDPITVPPRPTTTTTSTTNTSTTTSTTTTTVAGPVPDAITVSDAFWATFEFWGARTCISEPFTAPYDLLASMSASFTGRPAPGESATGGRFVLNGYASSKFMGNDTTYIYDETEFTLGESWGWVSLEAGQTYRFQLETALGSAPADLLDYYRCSYTITFERP